MLITFEGIDGAGKTTALRGFTEETPPDFDVFNDELERTPGVFDRIPGSRPTREPGTYDEDGTEPGLRAVDHAMDTPAFWVAMATYTRQAEHLSSAEATYVDRALTAVYFEELFGTLPPVFDETLLADPAGPTHWPDVFGDEITRMSEVLRRQIALIHEDIGLRRVIERYTARDCLRHAIMGTPESTELSPTASGLLFFAGHVLHQQPIETWISSGKLVLSDRYRESQQAYGPVRGARSVVSALYERANTRDPDVSVLFTCNPDASRYRAGARSKTEYKSWAGKQKETLASYRRVMDETPQPWIVIDTTELSRRAMIDKTTQEVKAHLAMEAV